MIKTANQDFYIKINTVRDYYNKADLFSAIIKNDVTNVEISTNDFSEIILEHDNHSANIINANIGDYKLEFDVSTLIIGDVFSYNNIYYYVKNIIGNFIYLFKPLSDTFTGLINQVGNTGIYKTTSNLDIGEYSIIVTSPLYDSNKVISVKIIEADIVDAHVKLDELSLSVDELIDDRNYTAFI